MTFKEAYIALHDWKTKRRMERSFQIDREPYRPATGAERPKYDALNALLSDRRYRAALDAGCAEGEMTRQLAPLCDRIVALDISETAIWRSMVNLADVSNVSFTRRNLRDFQSEIQWDLIVLSEVLPCLDAGDRWSGDLERLCSHLAGAVAPGGRLVLVSEFSSPESFQAAERYAELFTAESGLRPVREILTGGNVSDVRYAVAMFERAVEAQPAAAEGDTAGAAPARTTSSAHSSAR